MEDIFTALAPIYYYGKLFGNASYKPTGIVGYRVFHFDKTTWLVSTVICGLNVIYSLYICSKVDIGYSEEVNDDDDDDDDPAFTIINLIQLYIHVQLVVTIVAINTFYNKQHIWINQLTQFDNELNTMGLFLDYKKVSQRMTKRISLDILIILVLFIFISLDLIPWSIMIYINYIVERSTVMSMVIHFECWMHLIQERFMAIHNHLLKLVENDGTRLTNDTHRKHEIHNGFAKISKLHQDLCSFTRNINSKHSIQLFFIIHLTFIMLLMDQYTVWTLFLIKDVSESPPITLYWIVCDWINLIILLTTCSKTSDSANDIKKILNNIQICTTDSIIKQETMLFSLQLLHTDLNICAIGFFNVDYGLIYDMISVVTTYTVILFQFRIGSIRSETSTNTTTTTSYSMMFN